MKPPAFDYHDPDTLDEAIADLAQYGDDAKLIAGGQSLIPLLNFRLASPSCLIDLNKVAGLAQCSLGDGVLKIGSMVRHREVERSPVIKEHAPLLSMVAPFIGHPQIRTRGTLGGSLAHADPAAEFNAAVVAMDGRIHAQSTRGARSIPAEQFFRSFLRTALDPDEVILSVEIPLPPARTMFGFEEVATRRGDFALAGAAVVVTSDPAGSIERLRIVCLSAASTPVRLHAVEKALVGHQPSLPVFRDAGLLVADVVDPVDDIHATASYRRRVLGVLVRRALVRATGLNSEV